MKDPERVQRIRDALRGDNLDAILCALPSNVLLLSGYWPVVGNSLCVATRDGERFLLVPEDEAQLAGRGHADKVYTYQPGSLDHLQSVVEATTGPLQQLFREHHLACERIGYEFGPAESPAGYACSHVFLGSVVNLLREVTPASALAPADPLLARLASVKTRWELERIRVACEIAAAAFAAGRAGLQIGLPETAAAERFRGPLSIIGTAHAGVERAGGFAWCMSGAHSAEAFAAYARSRDAQLARHDLILVHCNSYADGHWTDITRTYVLGAPDERQTRLYDAVFSARAAALAAVRPGVLACDVDRAARDVLRSRDLDHAFRHSTGHGVGFSAISPHALPRIHPKSEDRLEEGMVFNIEPAVYFESYGGLRHCDMVAVTATGAELLTAFQGNREDLVLMQSREAA